MGTTTTRRKSGVMSFADSAFSKPLGQSLWDDCPLQALEQDPSIAFQHFDHFRTYAAADWTKTTVDAGAGSSVAISDAAGGVLAIANGDQDNDSSQLQHVGESFQLVPGKPAWIEAGFAISDVTQSDFLFGLCITDTTLIAGMTDGVFFQKDDGDAILDYHVIKDSTETGSNGATGVTLADNTWFRTGLKFLETGDIEIWVNGTRLKTVSTNVPDDELLRLSMAIQNGEAAAKTLSADYIRAVQILRRY